MTERHRDGITLSSTKGHPHSTPPAPISFAYLTDVPLLDNYANIFPRGSPESSSKVIYTSNIKMQIRPENTWYYKSEDGQWIKKCKYLVTWPRSKYLVCQPFGRYSWEIQIVCTVCTNKLNLNQHYIVYCSRKSSKKKHCDHYESIMLSLRVNSGTYLSLGNYHTKLSHTCLSLFPVSFIGSHWRKRQKNGFSIYWIENEF